MIVSALAAVSIGLALCSADRSVTSLPESGLGMLIVPIQSFNFSLSTWFKDTAGYFKNINDLINENKNIKEELLEARAEVSRLRLLQQENSQLEALLKIKNNFSQYDIIGADVIAKDPGNWFNTFTINKGTDSGLARNMVVMSGDGLIGKISECGYNYSKVISIINDSDAVSVQSLRTNDVGYITGSLDKDGMCRMQYSDDTADFVVGDEIVTSQLSRIYPPGIVVGHITQLTTDSKNMMKYAIIEPAADFKHMDKVLIINQLFSSELIATETTTQE